MDYYDPGLYGTDGYWKYPLGYLFVDSVKHFCEEYKAFWTLDVIGSRIDVLEKYEFLVIYFDVSDGKCLFHVKEDSDKPDIISQEIPFTDLLVSIKLFWEGGVLLFPSDH